ncbi:MAG: hypothetical protein R6V46_18425 [Desulfatiglandaceae bacterium]
MKVFSVSHRISNIGAIICVLPLLVTCAVRWSHASKGLEYENGFVTVQESGVSLISFLENLSELAFLKIYVVETIDPTRRIQVNFEHQQIEKVLRFVLKGYNHAIVFNVPQHRQPAVFSYNTNESRQTVPAGSVTDSQESQLAQTEPSSEPGAIEPQRQMLTQTIDELNQRIESGLSDMVYEKWVKVRGPKYVVHDRDRLRTYQGQLSRLLGSAVDLLK